LDSWNGLPTRSRRNSHWLKRCATVALSMTTSSPDDTDLLTARITSNRSLPEELRRSAAHLHNEIRRIVEQVARQIEDARYRKVEMAVSELDTGLRERERAKELVKADKAMHISYETLRLTVEFFGDLNQTVLRRIENESASPEHQSNMMFGNAIMIYEIADFVIGYIRTFRLGDEHKVLHADAKERVQTARRRQTELERKLAAPGIDPAVRDQTLEDIRIRTAAFDELDRQWERYMEEIQKLHALVDDVKGRVPTLEIIRENAEIQIMTLQLVAMLRFLQRSTDSIRGALNVLQGLRLAPLSSDRVRALLGV
jgi:hypothetical protein